MAAKSDGAPVSLSSSLPRNHHEIPPDCTPPPPPAASNLQRSPDAVEPRYPAEKKSYSLADCSWTLCALLVFFSDGASDLWLAADYYLRQEYRWFALTLLFVVVPSVVVQALSFRWFAYDYSERNAAAEGGSITVRGGEVAAEEAEERSFSTNKGDSAAHQRGAGRDAAAGPTPSPGGRAAGARGRRCCRVCVWTFQSVIHLLQLAQVWRYVHALYLGVQSRWRGDHKRHHFYWRVMFESADISMLRLLESFLKSAPQLVLQLSIMVHTSQVLPLQGLSASASLVSLSWMMSSYQKVLRDSRDDKRSMHYRAVVVHMLWQLFSIGARALAFALFASAFQLYFGIFIVTHWCLVTFWIIQGETDFCMSKWEEIIYNMMVGVVYIFCWFSVREGRTRCRMALYSLVVFGQNVALTAAWYVYRGAPPHSNNNRTADFTAVVLVCVVASSYALGTFFMFVYYCLLHPDGPISGWGAFMEDKEGAGGAVPDVLGSPASTLPPDVVSSPPRTLQRTKGGGEQGGGGIVGDVFQVRAARGGAMQAIASASHLGSPRTEGPVIRIDLPRKRYPAWDAHFIDRRLRKTILVLEGAAPVTPRIQYRCLGTPKEVMEYETTV